MTITLSRRTALAGLGLLCSTTALAACSGGASDDRLKVVIISKSYQNQFYQAAFKGAKDAADKLSVDLETNGPDAESNVSQQVEQLAAAVNQHPDAIALAASQPDAVQDALVNAKSQSIPVIGFDSGVPGDASGAVVATATTDNVAAGGNVATNLAANEAFKTAVGAGTTSAPAVIGVNYQDRKSVV